MLSATTASRTPEFPSRISAESSIAPVRRAYYDLLHIDEHPNAFQEALAVAKARLKEADAALSDSSETLSSGDFGDLDARLPQMRAWWLSRQLELVQSLANASKEQCAYLLKQYAPTALLDGCWMQN